MFKGPLKFIYFQVSITPARDVSFVSEGYGRPSSCRFTFSDCDVFSKFPSNSACMVDRGLNVQDLLLTKQVKLYMPPFTKCHGWNGLYFFQSVVPLTLKDVLDDMVVICAALTNLLPPVIGKVWKWDRDIKQRVFYMCNGVPCIFGNLFMKAL